MLIGVQRTWVDVNVGVKLLDGYFIAACLKQFSNGGGDNAFSQRGNDTARNKDIFCVHKTNVFYGLQSYALFRFRTEKFPIFQSTFLSKITICKKKNVFSCRILSVYQKFAPNYYKLSKTCKTIGKYKESSYLCKQKNKEANTLKNLKPQRRCVMFCGVDCYIGRNHT